MTEGGGTSEDRSGWASPGWGEPAPGGSYGPPPAAPGGSYEPAPAAPGGWGPDPTPRPGVIPLRPLGLGEVLDGAITTIRRHPAVTLGLAAVVVTATQLIDVLARWSTGTLTTVIDAAPAAGASALLGEIGSPGALAIYALGLVVSAVLGAVLTGMLVVVVGEAVLGRAVRLADVWNRVRPRFWGLLGASLLSGLLPWVGIPVALLVGLAVALASPTAGVVVGLLLAALLLVVPGAVLWGMLSLTTPALVLEGLGPLAALRRSWQLVRPDFFRVWGIRALAVVLGAVISGVVAIPFSIAAAIAGASSGSIEPGGGAALLVLLIATIGGIIAGTVVEPFLSGVIALLYVDRRIRGEGLDIQLQQAAREAAGTGYPG